MSLVFLDVFSRTTRIQRATRATYILRRDMRPLRVCIAHHIVPDSHHTLTSDRREYGAPLAMQSHTGHQAKKE